MKKTNDQFEHNPGYVTDTSEKRKVETDEARRSAITTRIDPRLLYQLAIVVQLGSLSRAADELLVTQPTLTRNIKLIEEIVGAPVLNRGRHGVSPTDIGLLLSKQGQAIRHAVRSAVMTVDQWNAGLTSEIRIAQGPLVAATLMPSFMTTMPLSQLQYTIKSSIMHPIEMAWRLGDCELDIAITPPRYFPNATAFGSEPLFSDSMCVVAGALSPLAALDEPIHTDRLRNQNWISVTGSSSHHSRFIEELELLGLYNVAPVMTFHADASSAIAMLKVSDVLMMMPRRMADIAFYNGGAKILDVDAVMPSHNISLFISRESAKVPCVMDLCEKIRHHFAANLPQQQRTTPSQSVTKSNSKPASSDSIQNEENADRRSGAVASS